MTPTIYINSHAEASFVPPAPKRIVGALFSLIGGDIVFTADMTLEQIKAIPIRNPKFNQLQIEDMR